ncbi:MAG TPA: YciI family protein [Bacteroidales bacterium]|nr:YciI family protein [Bacteroidales bacterium]
MEKKYFVLYLLPSRPDFAETMTDEERAVMMKHVEYWTEIMNQGKVLAFGPVMDPEAVYGLGIISVESEEEVKEFITNDPASRINRYQYFPMRAIVPGKP